MGTLETPVTYRLQVVRDQHLHLLVVVVLWLHQLVGLSLMEFSLLLQVLLKLLDPVLAVPMPSRPLVLLLLWPLLVLLDSSPSKGKKKKFACMHACITIDGRLIRNSN